MSREGDTQTNSRQTHIHREKQKREGIEKRETQRQTDRQTESQRGGERQRQRERGREGERER